MSLFVSSLNSGSNGNSYYVGNEEEAVLIDAGISSREIERRLKRQELSIRKVKAIFITHEHADHIGGLRKLAKRHLLPVYMTTDTRKETRIEWRDIQVRHFTPHEEIVVGKLRITPFPIQHDASDPHGFLVSHGEVSVGVFTDLGTTQSIHLNYFRRCHAAFLESNYDEEMLENGTYPQHLKERIRSDHGHLSNLQALQFFMSARPPFMSHLFLSHLSQNNNSPDIVRELFSNVAGKTEIVIASRYKESGVFHVGSVEVQHSSVPVTASQLSLF
jgi:phosphoribosyl 1,2-cyclic phosphodiesterase